MEIARRRYFERGHQPDEMACPERGSEAGQAPGNSGRGAAPLGPLDLRRLHDVRGRAARAPREGNALLVLSDEGGAPPRVARGPAPALALEARGAPRGRGGAPRPGRRGPGHRVDATRRRGTGPAPHDPWPDPRAKRPGATDPRVQDLA